MSTPDIAQWLRSLGLSRYEQAFADNDIDGEVLAELDDADLEKLGVSLGHRKKLLKAIAALAVPGGSAPAEAGAAAGIEGERRQVTVLFADLAGYTRMTRELGAEAMHAITDRFFGLADGLIERFGGSIDKHIGDCVMAVFGAPVAHGNDPERAVRAALAIRDAMPDLGRELGCALDTHIGIASGQVVASRGAGHKAYSITGDSVNLASRLTDQAAAGTILVSEPVRRLLADRLDHVEVDPFALKGMAAPVRAFRVNALREARTAERPFVGRRLELQQLESVLEACRAQGRGQAVHIRGEAGIGKTRLVEELQLHATGAGFVCHKGLVLDFGAGAGQDATASLVRSLLGLGATSDEAATSAALEAATRNGLLEADRRVFLNDLLDLPQPTALRALYDAMDHGARSRGRQDAVAELVERAGQEAPQLVDRRGHPLGGRADARPPRAPRPDRRHRACGAGHDVTHGRRSARPGLAGQRRRQPACDPRPRSPARRRGRRPGARLRRCQRRAGAALRRPGCRQPVVPRPAAAARRGERRGGRARLGAEPGPGPPRPPARPPTARRCRRHRCSVSVSPPMRSAICWARGPTTAPLSCAICWCDRSATSSCSPTR